MLPGDLTLDVSDTQTVRTDRQSGDGPTVVWWIADEHALTRGTDPDDPF